MADVLPVHRNGTRINVDAVVLLDVFCQAQFILVLDVHEFLLALRIIHIYFNFARLRKIGDPLVANLLRDPVCKKRVCREAGNVSG